MATEPAELPNRNISVRVDAKLVAMGFKITHGSADVLRCHVARAYQIVGSELRGRKQPIVDGGGRIAAAGELHAPGNHIFVCARACNEGTAKNGDNQRLECVSMIWQGVEVKIESFRLQSANGSSLSISYLRADG